MEDKKKKKEDKKKRETSQKVNGKIPRWTTSKFLPFTVVFVEFEKYEK